MMVKNIIFDFDGVILDSMAVRELGFRKIFAAYDEALVEELLQYHQENGGLSRYNKIAHFYNEILHEPITQTEIDTLAAAFSEIMRETLTDHRYLIAGDGYIFAEKCCLLPFAYCLRFGSERTEISLRSIGAD